MPHKRSKMIPKICFSFVFDIIFRYKCETNLLLLVLLFFFLKAAASLLWMHNPPPWGYHHTRSLGVGESVFVNNPYFKEDYSIQNKKKNKKQNIKVNQDFEILKIVCRQRFESSGAVSRRDCTPTERAPGIQPNESGND